MIMLSGKLRKLEIHSMAIDQEFLGRIDQEIARVKARIESKTQGATALHETERLKNLEDMRRRLIEQSRGG